MLNVDTGAILGDAAILYIRIKESNIRVENEILRIWLDLNNELQFIGQRFYSTPGRFAMHAF